MNWIRGVRLEKLERIRGIIPFFNHFLKYENDPSPYLVFEKYNTVKKNYNKVPLGYTQ